MTGPEHYLAAEQILDSIEKDPSEPLDHKYSTANELAETRDWMILAQIHATLALAAATALGAANPDNDPDAEWWDATHG